MSSKRAKERERGEHERQQFNRQVVIGHEDEVNEHEARRAKTQLYREEIVRAWDRTAKLKQIKGKLEKELGIAINDDKIKYIMKMQKEQ